MKRKSIKILTTTLLLSTMLSFSAFADWEQVGTQWKYKDDTTNVYVTSQWIESTTEKGLWYYIDQTGVMAVNTTTPDGYYVNDKGEWRNTSGGNSSVNPGNENNNQEMNNNIFDWSSGIDLSDADLGEAVDKSSAENFLNNR